MGSGNDSRYLNLTIIYSFVLAVNLVMLILAAIVNSSTGKQRKRAISLLLLCCFFFTNVSCCLLVSIWAWVSASLLHTQSNLWCIGCSYATWLIEGLNRMFLLFIALDRFLAVMNPFRYQRLMRPAKLMLGGGLYCVGIIVVPRIGGHGKGYVYYEELNFCLPVPYNSNSLFTSWYIVSLTFPILILVVLYSYMIHYLGRRVKRGKKVSLAQSFLTPRIKCKKRTKEVCDNSSLHDENKLSSSDSEDKEERVDEIRNSANTVRSITVFPRDHHMTRTSPQNFLIPKMKMRKGISDSALLRHGQPDNNYNHMEGKLQNSTATLKTRKSETNFSGRVRPSDHEIKRCSSTSTLTKPDSRATLRSLSVNGRVFSKFKSIYITVGSCLLEIVIVTLAKVVIFVVVTVARKRLPILSLHVDLVHLSLTPILYSFGFAPLKNRLSRVFKVGAYNNTTTNMNNNNNYNNSNLNNNGSFFRQVSRSFSKRGNFSQ